MSFNKVILEGRLTRDPNLETVGSNNASLCNFDIAVDDGFGEHKKTTYITVTTWAKKAEFVSKYFKKGDGILVEGRLSQDGWKDKETGKMRYRHRVTLETVQFPVGSQKNNYNNEEENGHENNDIISGWGQESEIPG